MRILIVGNLNSNHIIRLVCLLHSSGHEIAILTIHKSKKILPQGIRVIKFPFLFSFGYFFGLFALRLTAVNFNPNIINTHYASGYGFLTAVSFLKYPKVLSVWGSDIYLFPLKSFIHKFLLTFNLSMSTVVASTSICMAKRTRIFCPNKNIFITPFGVDATRFIPLDTFFVSNSGIFRIGTVKTLHFTYGIDVLLKAFAFLLQIYMGPLELRLEIAGEGPDRKFLEGLSRDLKISDNVTFHGAIEHSFVPEFINKLDIFAALSRFESFGVSVLEASACSKPVVVSDAEGLAEIVINNETGFIVPREDPISAANIFMKLIYSPSLRHNIGFNGRAHVLKNYSDEITISSFLKTYVAASKVFENLS